MAIEAVQLACRLIQRLPLKMETKTDMSPVTIADYASQGVIMGHLEDHFIAEESEASEDMKQLIRTYTELPLRWTNEQATNKGYILDPIDGTKGYLRGGQYAVCLAYFDEVIQFSVIGCPRLGFPSLTDTPGTLMVAIKDQGCYQIGLFDNFSLSSALACHACPSASVIMSFESQHCNQETVDEFLKHNAFEVHRMDSQAKYCVVARGEAGVYLRPTPYGYTEKLWDHAAGILAIREAGGIVKQTNDRPINIEYMPTFPVSGLLAHHTSLILK